MTVAPIWGAAARTKKVTKKVLKSSDDANTTTTTANSTSSPVLPRSLTTAAAGPSTMNKDLGQHLLKNPQMAATITAAAKIAPGDTVVEIGPGTGNLTVHILASPAARVIAMEMDPRMVCELHRRFAAEIAAGRLEIVEGDFLKQFDGVVAREQKKGGGIDLVISNTPYQISSPLVYKLLEQLAVDPTAAAAAVTRPTRALVLMFQQEFVDRLLATPGDAHYGKLPVLVNQYGVGGVEYVCKVGKNNFRPPPKVESAVVKIDLLLPLTTTTMTLESDDLQQTHQSFIPFAEFDGLVRHVFTRKNKTFGSCFNNKTIMRELEAIYERRHQSLRDDDNNNDDDLRSIVKAAVEAALADFADERPSKCDYTVFRDLLLSFHAHGIYFS
ncbi:hypothetical protein D0Z03_001832 [Geotrichum reessii]|nr:hypothetical protein D0Z03_001832 [Galactomyces reessii]